jgi:hypothetical protein
LPNYNSLQLFFIVLNLLFHGTIILCQTITLCNSFSSHRFFCFFSQ